MSLVKTLTKHGNSLALILDRPLLDLFGIDAETPLEITTADGVSIIVTPYRDDTRRKKLKSALAHVDKRYGPVFKRLASK